MIKLEKKEIKKNIVKRKTWTMQSFNDIYKNAWYYYIEWNFNMFPSDSTLSDLMQLYH